MYQHKLDKVELLTNIISNIQPKTLWISTPTLTSGNTDNMFYKRAVEIVKTRKDPLAKFLGDEK